MWQFDILGASLMIFFLRSFGLSWVFATFSFILEMFWLFSLSFSSLALFWEGYVTNSFNLEMFRSFFDDIGSWVRDLWMIAEIKYLLGIVGRFIASAFISTVLWTFPGRIRRKLRHLGDVSNLLWPRGSTRLIRLHLDDKWEIPFADI